MDREAEFNWLMEFVEDELDLNFFESEQVVKQTFKALWTAFCFHHSLDVDTLDYDNYLFRIWVHMSTPIQECWGKDYEIFDVEVSDLLC